MLLEELARQEIAERERRSLERRKSDAKLGRFKPIDEFDWNWPTKIDRGDARPRARPEELVAGRENLVLVAAQGLGKTMLAATSPTKPCSRATRRSSSRPRRCCSTSAPRTRPAPSSDGFVTTQGRISCASMRSATSPTTPAQRTFSSRSSPDATKQKSIVITTNLAFSDWPDIFPNASCVTALIDRLTHHADICLIEGESYRRREAEETRKARESARKEE